MAEFGWSKIYFLFLLQITAAVTAQPPLFFTVRDGDEVTLPCENVLINDHDCNSTTWLHTVSSNAVPLFEHGRIHINARAKADRLSVTADCSLGVKKVSAEDAGLYTCRRFKSGQQQGPGSQIYLSVASMTEHRNTDEVTLNCSVLTNRQCPHTVKWLFENKSSAKDDEDIKTSQSTCSASVTFKTRHFIDASRNYKLLKCNVTDDNEGKVHLFAFKAQSSGKEAGEEATVPTTTTTTATGKSWWWYILVALGLAALLITVAVVRWRTNKANRTQDDNSGLTSNPAVTQSPLPETSRDTADPDDGVSYAYISHGKKTHSRAQIRGGDEAVTYSTVKAPSSSTGASVDSSNLYATIN